MTTTDQDEKQPWRKTSAGKAAMMAGAIALSVGIVTATATIIAANIKASSEDGKSANPTTTATPTIQEGSSASSEAPESEPSSDSFSDDTISTATVQYLCELEPVTGDDRKQVSSLNNGSETLEFNSSVMAPINSFNTDYSFVYTIGNGWKYFRVTIGIDVESEPGAKVLFRIYLNDKSIDSGHVLEMNEVKEIAIPLNGESQIKLFTEVQASGIGGSGRATWGDARFTLE